jgi:hypothetical protein
LPIEFRFADTLLGFYFQAIPGLAFLEAGLLDRQRIIVDLRSWADTSVSQKSFTGEAEILDEPVGLRG